MIVDSDTQSNCTSNGSTSHRRLHAWLHGSTFWGVWGFHITGYKIVGSILRSPHFGKLPYSSPVPCTGTEMFVRLAMPVFNLKGGGGGWGGLAAI